MDARRKHEILGSEKKDLIIHGKMGNLSFLIALISILTPKSQVGRLEMDPGRCWAPSVFVSLRKNSNL